ncbi:MAG: TIR domain-containing protein [Chloroflexaceae bacterium]|nr:TIR domain-containing protein [Chloroflexaceae bacterium]
MPQPRRLRVFLCHADEDRSVVRSLYRKLQNDGFEPWLAEKDLLSGSGWREEIPRVVRGSDVFVACLSRSFITRRSHGHRQIHLALDTAQELPGYAIFIIPLNLEPCAYDPLIHLTPVNYFEDGGYEQLRRTLVFQAQQLGVAVIPPPPPVFRWFWTAARRMLSWLRWVFVPVVVLSLLIVACAGVSLAVPQLVNQVFPPLTGKIVFRSDRDGNYEIYVMNADGSNQTRLTYDGAKDSFPAWSPDGGQIAFQTDRNGNWDIYVMNSNGSNQRQLTSDEAHDMYPSWSPDGSRIAFASERSGDWDIYVMDADGSRQVRLTGHTKADAYPAWSPDGRFIAFQSDRDAIANAEVYLMGVDGSNQKCLTCDMGTERGNAYPAWSPDSTFIAFRSFPNYGNTEICVMRFDGSGKRPLTNNRVGDSFPTWSPDGNHIAFQSNRDGNWDVYVMPKSGFGQKQLTTSLADDRYPDWSP